MSLTISTFSIAFVNEGRPNDLPIIFENSGIELGWHGDPCVRTPHFDELAYRCCRLANAYDSQAVCSASRAGVLAGLHPFQNGQFGLATHRCELESK